VTDSELGGILGIHYTRFHQFRRAGKITVQAADKICCSRGVHLSYVYGDIYWAYLDERVAFDVARARKAEVRKQERAAAKRRTQQTQKELQQCV
jgi:hypothetical protein